ncbi:hypothetical protein NCTGTJJY_CDS0242 [Serratia phage 92A1]|nr:hypothetical protein NCTGTJJY_CDS0242 [Serratia phage 92A1]
MYFVKDASWLEGIKATRLRKLMKTGCCNSTLLEKKSQFDFVLNPEGLICSVNICPPGTTKRETIFLNQSCYIRRELWDRIMEKTVNFDKWYSTVEHKQYIRSLITNIEIAAQEHGRRKAIVEASPNFAYVNTYLKESGSVLTKARRALYEEINVA